jgi:isopenicillin N synthase-like dioxygenase
MTNIPVVDFAKAINGTTQEKEQVARQIDEAFQNVGFVYLKNHSVPLDMVAQCFDWVSLHIGLYYPRDENAN